jgi:tetratricopeptide (TPR) repeat protein
MNTPNDRTGTPLSADRMEELERTCFVIMPFGKKKVGDKEVDFTALYHDIFEPAIQAATTPEGAPLLPARTDMDAFSGSINQEMFEYIMYSRMAFADISGFNPNVFYEIGVRHSSQESGTVLFRQLGHAIPFDITTIKVFEYDHEQTQAERSRGLISQVLSDSLRRNRLDSPVRLALRAQFGGGERGGVAADATRRWVDGSAATTAAAPAAVAPAATPAAFAALGADDWRRQEVERFMRDAEDALRFSDLAQARMNYWGALRFDPTNLIARMRLGLILKREGRMQEALEEFVTLTRLAPTYAEAWKEKGVIEGLIARSFKTDKRPDWLQDGFASLDRARHLNPDDFDTWSSLGGVLKNVRKDPVQALAMYRKAAQISDGHPYPLLNALRLQAQGQGGLDLGAASVQEQLVRARSLRLAQTQAEPPADTPWCFFDLAEIALYQGDGAGFLATVDAGLAACTQGWQRETFLNSLRGLATQTGIEGLLRDVLAEGIARLEAGGQGGGKS